MAHIDSSILGLFCAAADGQKPSIGATPSPSGTGGHKPGQSL
jgi:hypothetical protein